MKDINRMSRPKHTGKFVDELINPQQELIKFVYKEDSGI